MRSSWSIAGSQVTGGDHKKGDGQAAVIGRTMNGGLSAVDIG